MHMDGVIDAEASFISGTVKIKFDDTKTNVDEIIRQYKQAGLAVLGKPKWIE
jgi:copper chaperone CopZ